MSPDTPPPEAEEGEGEVPWNRVIHLDRRSPNQLLHYTQGWLAAASAIHQGMRSDLAMLHGKSWLTAAKADDPAVPKETTVPDEPDFSEMAIEWLGNCPAHHHIYNSLGGPFVASHKLAEKFRELWADTREAALEESKWAMIERINGNPAFSEGTDGLRKTLIIEAQIVAEQLAASPAPPESG